MRVLYLTFVVVFVDQFTKLYVKGISIPWLGVDFKGIPYGSSIELISNFFQFTFIENPGMAFGIEIGGKLGLSLFTVAATVIIIYFIFINRKESSLLRIALAFILGGALGNLIDRIFYGVIFNYAPLFHGKVVDFFHLNIPDFTILGKTFHSWPIFNIADISVSIGFLIILFSYKKIFRHHDAPESEESPEINDSPAPTDTPPN